MFKKKFPSLSSLGSDGNTYFLRAARAGNLDKVLEQLKNNVDINTSNANGLNALHLASKDGHVHVVTELLKRGANVDSATKKGNTALHIASLAGQEEVVRLLVEHGASVNVQSQNGFTPLYMAAQENHDNVVKFLLANGANQSLATEDGFTPLAVAMQQGHDKVVAVLLENDTRGKVRLPALHIAAKKDDCKAAALLLQNEHNPDVTSKSGFTPLHIASHYGNENIANLLLSKGADVNYSAKHNITPLHVAAKWGKANMVSLLLEKGANIESKTRDGLTPLHCAARSGHEQVVDMLLERGAPISSKTKNGLAPLHMSSQGDHVDAARILLYHRAPVDEVTVDYLTALHVAAHCGHARVAKLLLDRKADPNARALNGFTPLHIACKKNRIKVVELLLKHGASIEATTESGLTPLHVASFMGCMNIVIYLLQNEANPDVPTVRGETPLHLAARANQTDIIRILLRHGAQVDARAREQQTPLHVAARLGNVDIVMLLLQHGAAVDSTTKDLYTALHIAAKEGQDEVAQVLLENNASPTATTKKGFTPLHLAAKYGNMKVARLLLQRDAPVDAQGKNGVTPLHVASHYDHQNVALLLLDKGASPHATAKNGHTPLHIAAKKNQMDIATTLLEYGAKANAESKAGFTPLHLSSQEGHIDMSSLLIDHQADTNHKAKNGLTPLHLCAQEDRVNMASVLVKNGAEIDATTKAGYTPLHVACHFGQLNMVRFLLDEGAKVSATTAVGYTPLHQAAQQGHSTIVNTLLESGAPPNATTNQGQTALSIAQKLGYISVVEALKGVTEPSTITPTTAEEKYKVVSPETMQETFMSDSEDEGGEDTLLTEQPYRYLTVDEMKSLGDDSLPIDVTRDERLDSNREVMTVPPTAVDDTVSPQHLKETYNQFTTPDNVDISRHPLHVGFLVSFLVDARGGAMRGCRHSGVRVIVPPRRASMPMRVTCRYLKRDKLSHPPPLMEGEALASRILEFGPVGAKFLGPVMIEVPHFGSLRGKEREIVILRSDNGETWREHTVEATDEAVQDILSHSFDKEEMAQLEDASRTTRILTTDFPHYFAVVTRVRQEVHAIGPEGGMVSSSVVPQVQAVFPQGALTKKIKVGLQAQPISAELAAKLLGNRVAVSPIVTVEPRRRKFHKPITLTIPKPQAANKGMINQYSGDAPTLRLLCSITGGTTRAQWEDVTGSTPFTFVNDCVSFTTTVSARFWLMDCRNVADATKMATELYREAIHVPFMAKFVVFAKRVDVLEARLRVFCMTDDKEDKTLEHQEHFTEVAKSRDVEVLEGKSQYIEFAGNLIPVTKSGEQLQLGFRAFRENRLPFTVRVKDPHADTIGRMLFMREPKVAKGEPPQQPICVLNIVLPEEIIPETGILDHDLHKYSFIKDSSGLESYQRADLRLSDISNLLGEDWVRLAGELGVTTSDINRLKSEYPNSDAQQGLAMLRLWVQQAGNKAQASTLEAALSRLGRDDIVQQCIFNIDQSGFDLLKEELGPSRDASLKRNMNVDNVFSDQEIMKDTESRAEITRVSGRKAGEPVEKDDKEERKYIAEEKEVEEVKKSVSERRKEIEERLSSQDKHKEKIIEKRPSKDIQLVEETLVVTQKQKIVEDLSEKEIPEEKKLSQDQSPEPSDLTFEQKRLSFEQGKKIIEMKPDKMKLEPKEKIEETLLTEERKASAIKKSETEENVLSFQEKRMSFEQSLKQTESIEKEVKHPVEDKRTEERRLQDQRRDSELFEGVSQGLVRLDTAVFVATPQVQDMLSPKVSKTPPPSPAEFKDTTGTVAWEVESAALLSAKTSTAQDWSKKSEKPVEEPTPATVADSQEKLESSRFIQSEHGLPTDGSDSSLPKPSPRIPKHDSSDESLPKSATQAEDDIKDYSVRKKFWEQISTSSIESEVKVQQRTQDSVTPPVPRPRSSIVASVPLLKSEAESDTETTATTLSDSTVRIKNLQHDAVSKQSFTGSSDASDKEEGSEPEAVDLSGQILVQSVPTTAPPVVSEITDEQSSKDDQTAAAESSDSEAEYIAGKISGGGTLAYENVAFDAGEEITEDRVEKLHEVSDKSKISVSTTQSVTEKTKFTEKDVPVAAVRKTVYERSVSLPTEDITDVPASSVRARKRFFEAQIKKEMVVDQLMTQLEEESSPEHKALHYTETDKPTTDPEAMVSRQIHSHIFSHELDEQIESLIPESKHIVEEKTEIIEEIKPVTVKEIASVFDKIDAKKSVKRTDSVSYEAEIVRVEPDTEEIKLPETEVVAEVAQPTETKVDIKDMRGMFESKTLSTEREADRKEVKVKSEKERVKSVGKTVEETSVSEGKVIREKFESEEKTVKKETKTGEKVLTEKCKESIVKEKYLEEKYDSLEKTIKEKVVEEKVEREEKFVKEKTAFEVKHDIERKVVEERLDIGEQIAKEKFDTKETLIKDKTVVQAKLVEPVILDSIIDYEVVEEEVLDILPCKEAVMSGDIVEVMQYKTEVISKPSDSLEVHIDKSEIEETEKEREIDEEIKHLEGEEDKAVKPAYYYGEEEVGQSVSVTPTSKRTESYSQGESEDTQSESDVTPEDAQTKQLTLGDWEQQDTKQEDEKKMDLEKFHPVQDQRIHTPEEHIPDTVWEVPVQQEPETVDQEILQDIPIGKQIIVEKDEDDSQRSLTESLDIKIADKEEVDMHDEHKISEEEARKIAKQVVDDIETEITKRSDVIAEFDEVLSTPVPSVDTAESQVSEYLMQLTGKGEMEVKLIESVLAKKQREQMSKFARTDTTTSSMEITDEDLRSSVVDTDISPIESQASKLYPVEDKSEDDTESFLKLETEIKEDIEKLKEKEVLEKTLAEVKKSLEAAQEELIEEHKKKKDSVQKKESPSEFEFKVLTLDRTTEQLIEESHFEDTRAAVSVEGVSDGKHFEGTIDASIHDAEVSKQASQERKQVQSEYLRDGKKEMFKDVLKEDSTEKGELHKETKVDEKVFIKSDDIKIKMEQKGTASLSDDDGKVKSSKLEHVTVSSEQGVVSKVSSEEKEEETLKKGETYDFECKTEEVEEGKKVVKEELKKEDKTLEELKETTAIVEGTQEIFKDGTFVTEKSIEKYQVSTTTKTESKEEYHTESKVETSSKFEVDPSLIEQLMSEGLLQDDGCQVVVKVAEKEEIKRTYSEESQKSSQDDSIRSPVGADDVISSSSSSGRRGDSDTMHTLERPEVVMRRHKTAESRVGQKSADRRSGTDYEPYSSSGESHYHSFEQTSESIRTPSRPCSSDVEALIAGVAGTTGSSEYESAISHEISARSVTSHEYHTAVSSLSSRESMKSLDSESSGNLASVEVSSEASETLVPSAMELEKDMESVSGPIVEEEIMLKSVVEPYDTEIPHHVILGESPPRIPSLSEVKDHTQSISFDISAEDIVSEEEPEAPPVEKDESIPCRMKRSLEMTFQPEPRPVISETPPISESSSHEEKLGSSLDDAGSVISLSSVSDGTALKTVIELSRTESDKMDGSGTSDQISLTVSGTSEQFSLSSELREEAASIQTSRQETTISTQSTSQSGQVSSVTITTSAVSEDGIQSVCTQVTSQTETDIVSTSDELLEDGYTCSNGPTQVEYNSEYDEIKEVKKRPGHRRIESTTVKPSMIPVLTKRQKDESFIAEKHEGDVSEDMAESDKYADTSALTLKEGRCEEKKDIDEAERVEEESYTEADQGFHRELREGRLLLEDTSSMDEDQDDRDGEISRPQSQVSKSDSESGQRPMSAGFSDDRPDSELAELLKQCSSDAGSEDPIERPKTPEPVDECEIKDDTPEFSSEAQASVTELEIEYSGAFSRAVEYECHVSPIREKAGMPFEAWEHHTSDHEDELAEAEAAFQMVPHISPSAPTTLPATIPEDPIAEKHELETRELLLKEDNKTRSKFEATSPGSIPDITVTQHMTPLVDQGFHYPDLELEEEAAVKASAPQTPASMSSHASSETETDQGREYVLQEEDGDDYIAEEPDIGEVSATTEEKTVFETKDTEVAERDSATESPTSDSFEMLEKPDISDEFVIIEEVGKEAREQDREGKSVSIGKKRVVKKSDDTDVVVSPPAPATKMTDLKYYPGPTGDDVGPFPFDSESPPTNLEETQSGGETTSQEGSPPTDEDQGYENEVEAGKKWIEMQFQGDQLTTIYGYDIEYERGPLEDIKEEDPTDLEQCSSKFGSIGSQVSQSIGSFGSVKESLSSTPDYDVLAGRKYFTRSGDHDDVSMSSLQEFERLEKLIAMESRNKSLGSQESLTSSGNSKRQGKSGGDDISVGSLKEFEGLESACIEAAKIETKAKEEEALLSEIEEGHESQASECESCETISAGGIKDGDSDSDDYEKRMFEIDEIIRQAQTNVERFIDLKTEDRTESVGRGDSLEEVAKVPDLDLDQPLHALASTTVKTYSGKSYVQGWKDIEDEMLTSTDSLEVKTTVSKSGPQDVLTVSTDSLEVKPAGDKELMSQSTDSIEYQLQQKKSKPVSDLMTDSIEMPGDKTSLITSTDSLEMDPPKHITDSIEEEDEDMCGQAAAVHDQSSSSGREGDLSSSGKEDSGEQNRMPPPRAELALGSTDSLEPTSSTATHATYQYETDSVMSSSFTSGGSNTMVSSTETLDINARAGVWFEDGRPYVTEVIEPESDGDFSHTIHRTVELPPEIHKVTFHGPDADKALQEYIEKFAPGEDMTETRDVDKDGNVHVKRVIQRRVLIRPDELGGPTTDISGADLQEYLRHLSEEQRDDHGVTSSSYSSSYSSVISSVPMGPESSQQQLTTYQSKGESAVDDSKKPSVTSAETSAQKEGEEGLFDLAAGFQDAPASSGTGTPAPGLLPTQKPK